jgi:hypothetical protein
MEGTLEVANNGKAPLAEPEKTLPHAPRAGTNNHHVFHLRRLTKPPILNREPTASPPRSPIAPDEGDGDEGDGDGGGGAPPNACLGVTHCDGCAAGLLFYTVAQFDLLPPNSQTCCGDLRGPACVCGIFGSAAINAHFLAPPPGNANNNNRFAAYRLAYQALYGVGQLGVQIPLPHCTRAAISAQWP